MTAQIAEKLLFNGQWHSLCELPLDVFFALGGKSPHFAYPNNTALWRGYVGTWSIENGRLYLVALNGHLDDGTLATLETLFPSFPDRVFAHWYSGKLRCPRGRRLEYVHMGFGSTYEEDLLIEVRKGVVIGTEVRRNGTAEEGSPEGYGVGGFVVFPPEQGKGTSQGVGGKS